MAGKQENFSGIDRELALRVPGAAERRFSFAGNEIRISPASWRKLVVLEVPLLALLALVFIISAVVTPGFELRSSGIDVPWLYSCPLLALTGVPCLLCGMTRSFLAMGGLDLRQAFIFHPLGPVLFASLVPLAVVLLVSTASGRRFGISITRSLRRQLIAWGSLIVLAAWVAKIIIWRQTGLL